LTIEKRFPSLLRSSKFETVELLSEKQRNLPNWQSDYWKRSLYLRTNLEKNSANAFLKEIRGWKLREAEKEEKEEKLLPAEKKKKQTKGYWSGNRTSRNKKIKK